VDWQVARRDCSLRFDRAGVHWVGPDGPIEVPWTQVIDADIELPTSTLRQWHAIDLVNILWTTMGAPRTIQIGFALRRSGLDVDLGRPGRYRWQLQVVLDDLLHVLRVNQDFSALGRPEVMQEVQRLSTGVPAAARAFMYTDLLGLERYVGGRGAYRKALRAMVASE
jgi:hypothetical protein